ncbi:serine/threonine protein kinase [Streptomyces sp. ISL-22]|uniref:serine/threonine-protein kinase n=1 Tax=unclassified Streptomyces TaxID=2593676 RepID=UPI001BE879E6|nr:MULTISPECIES: serine/threonine-protein kinase [unclassified Streptomyces]MBT2422787.1 serine/threonine protein kinase [Streptomyces sp. ISL-24]MBT2431145.1 serine/threonine protein kinase [Streptomyces sp. ISL-22]
MGEVFAGRYELVDPIGRGGVGAVWRAWDHRRRRYVAAKVLQQSDAHSLLRFVREQALRIDHPHVLAPASWAADDDKVLFTMDLVSGGSLVHLIGDYGPLPPSFVCTLLDQLLAGLAAVHAEGVVHRDIKPANVLLEATGTGRPRLRLSDFGIAMRLGEPRLTETNLVVGTPGYLAPEQLMGAEPDFPADLFAVGLVALYLLEGAKPDAKALVQYFTEHGTPSAPKGIPDPLWQVVASLLQPDPHARFRTATGARKALASAAELLPEPGPDDELIEIFDQIGPLPPGFGPGGPLKPAPGLEESRGDSRQFGPGSGSGSAGSADTGSAATGIGFLPGDKRSAPTATGSVATATGSMAAGTGSGTTSSDPRQGVAGPAPAAAPDVTSTESTPPPHVRQPPSMSDTGSFHLPPPPPPPQATASSPQTPTPLPHSHAPHPPRPQAPPQRQAQEQRQAGQPQAANRPPAPVSPYDNTHVLSSPQAHAPQYPTQPPTPVPDHRVDASTASYTAQSPQVPPSAPRVSQPHRRGGHRAARRSARDRARRPGPPAKVAVPLLLLALACYAVGFWALAHI